MAVYPEIAAFGGKQGAIYLGAHSFSRLALKSFRDALSVSLGQVIAMAIPPFAVRFDSAVQANSGISAIDLGLQFDIQGRDVSLKTDDNLTLGFSLGILDGGNFGDVLTKFTLDLRNIVFAIDVSSSAITCSPGDAQINPSFARSVDFDQLIGKYKLARDTVLQVEGMLLFSGLATTITKTVSTPQAISLSRLFPRIAFVGSMEFGVSVDRKFLFLKGAQGIERVPPVCACDEIGNGIGSVAPGELKPGGGAGGSVGEITIGGPIPVTPTFDVLGRRYPGEGDVGLYMPTDVARKLATEGPFPAVRLDIRDNGFIGWKAAAFVDFDGITFTPEPKLGRFFVELTFRVEVYGSIHVDLGKFGKIRVTTFSAEQKGPGVNRIKIGVYLVVGTGGLYLKPVLEELDFRTFEVFLVAGTLVGTPFGGWGAVIGFIFDKILGLIIAYQIPIHLNDELREYMGKLMFTILDADYAAELAGIVSVGSSYTLGARYDGGLEGFLFSVDNAG